MSQFFSALPQLPTLITLFGRCFSVLIFRDVTWLLWVTWLHSLRAWKLHAQPERIPQHTCGHCGLQTISIPRFHTLRPRLEGMNGPCSCQLPPAGNIQTAAAMPQDPLTHSQKADSSNSSSSLKQVQLPTTSTRRGGDAWRIL